MIHDGVVQVTCDGKRCSSRVIVEYVSYDELNEIEDNLRTNHDWVVESGKHFCTYACAYSQDHTPPRPTQPTTPRA